MVTYIEDVLAPVKKEFDIATHWLGQERDFGQHKQTPLLQIRDLNMRFTLRNAFLKKNRIILDAVKQVSFSIKEGEVFGLVGESGSGKSTIERLIAGPYKANPGSVVFDDTDVTTLKKEQALNTFRRQIQMVFQDPFSSLNPRMRILDIVAEPIRFHKLTENEEQTRTIVGDDRKSTRLKSSH